MNKQQSHVVQKDILVSNTQMSKTGSGISSVQNVVQNGMINNNKQTKKLQF